MSDDERANELSRFLKERRSRLLPADVGLPAGGRRRVPGLRREEVASLAGIGVSWYTTLENGEADGVSEATLNTVAGALRLSDSEREYLLVPGGLSQLSQRPAASDPLVTATLHAIAFPAYIITATWDVVECNERFRAVWAIHDTEMPFNAVERLFLDVEARKMHGVHLAQNIRPVLAMLHSTIGRQPQAKALRRIRDRLMADGDLRIIWNDYEIANPLLANACNIASPIGTFHYETLTLPFSNSRAIVIQVPDDASRQRLDTRPVRQGGPRARL